MVTDADTDGDGLRQTENDLFDASGAANPNGVRDGVDKTPTPLVEFYDEFALPQALLVSRSFGTAPLLNLFGNVATQDVNFIVFSGWALGGDGYFTVMLIDYPFSAAQDPDPLTESKLLRQAVDTAPPYVLRIDTFG